MKHKEKFVAVAALIFCMTQVWAQETKSKEDNAPSKEVERVQAAAKVLDEIMSAPDKGIPQEVLESTKCIGVVPSLLKAGFVNRGGKGSHRNFTHRNVERPVTISGHERDDALPYQEKDVKAAIRESRGI